MGICGANIVCIDNNGRDDLLTVGQTYNVDSDGDIVTNEGDYMGVWVFNGGIKAGIHGNITFELEGNTPAGTQTVLATNKHFIGRKINMIKRIREATGLGLKEAKEIADKFGFYEEGTVEVEVPSYVRDQQAFNDVFMTTAEVQASLEQIRVLAGGCVLESEYGLAKRLISILEDFNYT